ncbi:PD-(D/E)XK nuclease family protein [Cerasicoccus fimbriatus]|uniref:PD-(D/E)XK nuclease family protein n=1 Tax=Cerasicoccus fimbriatus TaxID=3014554 RepID=UPI0022B5B53A|nr:PD-(D/E)XK nuclease family protein [Cerasicoccus sp. TK19100]
MPRLIFYRDPDAAWRRTLLPWFRVWPREAWRQALPVVFLAPDSSTIAWVKHRLVQAGVPALGIEFFTPGGLRALLRQQLEAKPLALREDLRLLMELAAGDLPDNLVAQATAREPGDFLRQVDRLEAAGWDASVLQIEEARALAERFKQVLDESGLQTSASADRALVAGAQRPVMAQVMAYGFGAGHGGSLTLLRALPQLAHSAAYCLPVNGDQRDELIWRSTLEQLGDSDEMAPGDPHPLADLATAVEFHQQVESAEAPFIAAIAPDINCEARVIENEIHRWRAKLAAGERIGVVFAQDGLPLARAVARRLNEAGIAHQDEIGHLPGQRPGQILVEAWRRYQELADADSARGLVRELRRAGRLTADEERAVWQALEHAFSQAMVTDVAVLRALLPSHRHGEAAARVLDQWPLLPEQATFAEFTEKCLPVLKLLRWPERLDAWEHRAGALVENLKRPLKRAQYLRWLAEVVRIPGRTRSAFGREAFAPIVLTTVERAAAQSWEYLVFAGLNRGDWPAEQSDSLLLDAKLCGRLNQRASMDSPVGQGQQCLRPGISWLPTSLDERRRFTDSCLSLLRNVRTTALFTAHRDNPADPGREQDLADWLVRLFHARFGEIPGDGELHAASQALAATFAEKPSREVFPDITGTFVWRRNISEPFDEFSFGFGEEFSEPLTLPSKAWENAITRPASAWLENILRVKPLKELQEDDPRSLAVGIWAHSWVQPPESIRAFRGKPEAEDWTLDIQRQAQAVFFRITDAFRAAKRELPDWWRLDWSIARSHALRFAASLEALDWQSIRTEWPLPGEPLNLPGHALDGLVLTGRIDVVLSNESADTLNDFPEGAWPTMARAWVIDFKTGSDAKLTPGQLKKGSGIQIALYALAMNALGSEQVCTTLLKPGDAIESQMSLEKIRDLGEPWEVIRRMATTGQIGLRGAQRDDFRFVGDYPLAHLAIDPGVLEEKWALTFGGEAMGEEF